MRVFLLRICYLLYIGRIRWKHVLIFLQLIKNAKKFTIARKARQLQRGRHGYRIREEGRRRIDAQTQTKTLCEKTGLQTTVAPQTATHSALQGSGTHPTSSPATPPNPQRDHDDLRHPPQDHGRESSKTRGKSITRKANRRKSRILQITAWPRFTK